MRKITTILLSLGCAAFIGCIGSSVRPRTNADSFTCKKIEFCMIGYHNPPGNECACVPD